MGAPSPAGWYQDPGGPGQRYFDGTQWTSHRTATLSTEQRSQILQNELVRFTSWGGRVVTQSPTSATLVSGQPVNTVAHILATVFLCGLWLPIWIYMESTWRGATAHRDHR